MFYNAMRRKSDWKKAADQEKKVHGKRLSLKFKEGDIKPIFSPTLQRKTKSLAWGGKSHIRSLEGKDGKTVPGAPNPVPTPPFGGTPPQSIVGSHISQEPGTSVSPLTPISGASTSHNSLPQSTAHLSEIAIKADSEPTEKETSEQDVVQTCLKDEPESPNEPNVPEGPKSEKTSLAEPPESIISNIETGPQEAQQRKLCCLCF